MLPSTCSITRQPAFAAAAGAPAVAAGAAGASEGSSSTRDGQTRGEGAGQTPRQQQDRDDAQGSSLLSAARGASNRSRQPQGSPDKSVRGGGGRSADSRPPQRQGTGPLNSDLDDEDDEGNEPEFMRLPDGRQVVLVKQDTKAALAASALTHALGAERQAVVRFTGAAGGLSGLRVLTLAHAFMAQFRRGLNFMVDVREGLYSGVPYNPAIHGLKVDGRKRRMARSGARAREEEGGAGPTAGRGKEGEEDEKGEAFGAPPIWLAGGTGGNVSFDYRVMARARNTEPWETNLQVGSRGYVEADKPQRYFAVRGVGGERWGA